MATESVKKTTAAKATKPTAAKTEAKSSPKVGKAPVGKLKITQVVGTIGRRKDQEATLIGLGLNKRHRTKVLEDTASVRGMVYKVRHLVKVESVN